MKKKQSGNKPTRKELRKQTREEKKERKRSFHIKKHPTTQFSTSSKIQNEFNKSSKKQHIEIKEDEEIVSSEDDLDENDDDIAVPSKKQSVVTIPTIVKQSKKILDYDPELAADEAEIAELERKLGIRGKKGDPNSLKRLKLDLEKDGFAKELTEFLIDGKESFDDDDDDIEEDEDIEVEEDDYKSEEEEESTQRVNIIRNNEKEDDDDLSSIASEADPMAESETVFLPSSNLYGESAPKPSSSSSTISVQKTFDRSLDIKIRGILNRCSDENITNSLKQIVSLFDEHPTQIVLDCTISNVLKSVSNATSLLFASLLFALETKGNNANVISNVLEQIVIKIENEEEKENYGQIRLMSNLCALGASSCEILLEILERKENEQKEEFFIGILESCGWKMRMLDPTRFRTVVLSLSTKFDSQILEYHGKNKFDYKSEDEKVRKWRKWISTIVISQDSGKLMPSSLNVSYDDFVNANKNGRWWILGSSWKQEDKDTLSKSKSSKLNQQQISRGNHPILQIIEKTDKKILEIAEKKFGFQTDLKKGLFCVIMSANDYIECFDKIIKLNLTETEERELVRMILFCCCKSSRYNPFFAMLSARLCSYNPRYRFSFQLAIWDELKINEEEEETTERTERWTMNFAKFVGELLSQFSISISILKVIHFVKIVSKRIILFLRELFLYLLIDGGEGREGDLLVAKIFSRLKTVQDGTTIRDGILVFWSRTEPFLRMKKNDKDNNYVLYKRMKIARRVMEHFVKSEEDKGQEDGNW